LTSAQQRSLDLTVPPLSADEAVWTDPRDYAGCQELAAQARLAAVQTIRTLSVRDAERRANIVILDPASFASQPRPAQTWHLRIEAGQLTALAAFPSSLTAISSRQRNLVCPICQKLDAATATSLSCSGVCLAIVPQDT
jgi:hypothetical protein